MTRKELITAIKKNKSVKENPELVLKLCNSLITQLNPILKKYETSKVSWADEIYFALEEIVNDLYRLVVIAEGKTYKKDEWEDMRFDGDFQQSFNDILDQLHDLGDLNIDNDKFLWIG